MDSDAITRLVMARCGDAMTPDEAAEIEARMSGEVISTETAHLITEAIDELQARLTQLEEGHETRYGDAA
jgi:hypothetical protein